MAGYLDAGLSGQCKANNSQCLQKLYQEPYSPFPWGHPLDRAPLAYRSEFYKRPGRPCAFFGSRPVPGPAYRHGKGRGSELHTKESSRPLRASESGAKRDPSAHRRTGRRVDPARWRYTDRASCDTGPVFTGFRLSELLGLTWDAVNFDRGTIAVDKQLSADFTRGAAVLNAKERKAPDCHARRLRLPGTAQAESETGGAVAEGGAALVQSLRPDFH